MPEAPRGMLGRTRQRPIMFAVLVLIVYVVVRRLAGLLGDPAIPLPPPQERESFRAEVVLPNMHGTQVRLADLRGRPVLLNFWATWCAPCRAEIPSMQALYERYHPRGLELLAIANDSAGAAVVAPFLQAYRVTFPVLLDPQNVISAQLQLPGIPTTYILDTHGRIAGFTMGARDWNTPNVHQFLEQLLAEDGSLTAP